MYITNEMNYGHLIDPENFNISLIQPELYEVFNNIKVNFLEILFLLKFLYFIFKGLESTISSS
jgi:ABC-type enterochelin transport system permease subunit